MKGSIGKEHLIVGRPDRAVNAGEIRKLLEGVPDDTPVLIQRVEDVYFTEHKWAPTRLNFEFEPSDYVGAFSAYKHPDENYFVINAHY